jgi:hypothetical protein
MKTPDQVAQHLYQLYNTEFGDKEKGHFVISRPDMRILAGRSRLEGGVMQEIANELFKRGLVLISLGRSGPYAIERELVLLNWRIAPRTIVTKIGRRKFVSSIALWPFPTGSYA